MYTSDTILLALGAYVVGCDNQVDLLIIVDSSESVIENDPYGKPLYNWKKTKVCISFIIVRDEPLIIVRGGSGKIKKKN